MTARLLLLVCAAAALTACGKRGSLERPPPLFGEARQQWEAEQAARRAREGGNQAGDPRAQRGGEDVQAPYEQVNDPLDPIPTPEEVGPPAETDERSPTRPQG